jgi:hypothetical protein
LRLTLLLLTLLLLALLAGSLSKRRSCAGDQLAHGKCKREHQYAQDYSSENCWSHRTPFSRN